ncbi:hypothetical protein TWF506_011372 [Arthrobotrys conoides]|uniref:Uncharacterized protein n=1 Tax=Arthrobotrys conoides TaxID=74498 RepID=A0AAN8NEF4_9PEZI
MPFAGIWTAVPKKVFFTPYRPHLEQQRTRWFTNLSPSKCGSSQPLLSVKENGTIEAHLITGKIPFMRETSDFCITGNRLPVLPERYSWAWLPNRPILQQWKSDVSDQTLSAENSDLYIPEVVIKLINGSLPSIGEASKYIKVSSGRRDQVYTTESAVLLSLLLVDGRLQAIWSLLEEEGGRFSVLQSKIDKFEYPPTLEQLKLISDAKEVDALTCDFIALWFELGNRADLVGDSGYLIQKFFQILDDWENDDTPCIPVLDPANKSTEKVPGVIRAPSQIEVKNEKIVPETVATGLLLNPGASEFKKNMTPAPASAISQAAVFHTDSDAGGKHSLPTSIKELLQVLKSACNMDKGDPYRAIKELKSRKELVQWARVVDKNGRKRSDLICKMLVLLQLRIFLMDLSYQCHSDSSDAYLAKAETSIAVRMI